MLTVCGVLRHLTCACMHAAFVTTLVPAATLLDGGVMTTSKSANCCYDLGHLTLCMVPDL